MHFLCPKFIHCSTVPLNHLTQAPFTNYEAANAMHFMRATSYITATFHDHYLLDFDANLWYVSQHLSLRHNFPLRLLFTRPWNSLHPHSCFEVLDSTSEPAIDGWFCGKIFITAYIYAFVPNCRHTQIHVSAYNPYSSPSLFMALHPVCALRYMHLFHLQQLPVTYLSS
jgi:hypothetical protein